MAKIDASQILHRNVSIRRSGKVIRNVLTQSLISEIRKGRLEKDDEISADEKNWVRLDQHSQLARYFSNPDASTSEDLPPDVEKRLSELSQILKELS
jgi:hypothetical protein